MHRVMAYTSFHRMQTKYPDLYPDSSHLHPNASSLNPACLPEEWQQWIDESLRDGIDGSALVDVLRDHSIEVSEKPRSCARIKADCFCFCFCFCSRLRPLCSHMCMAHLLPPLRSHMCAVEAWVDEER